MERLDKLIEPVFQFDTHDNLYSIDWSSSAIEHLGSVEFVLVVKSSNKLNFLDKNFNKIFSVKYFSCTVYEKKFDTHSLWQTTVPRRLAKTKRGWINGKVGPAVRRAR